MIIDIYVLEKIEQEAHDHIAHLRNSSKLFFIPFKNFTLNSELVL